MYKEQEIKRLAEKYNFKCNIFYNSILINSHFRDWICEKYGNYYRLKHLNREQYKHKNHLHKKKYNSLEEVFEFIKNHDTQVILDRNKRRRLKIDRLFAQINN